LVTSAASLGGGSPAAYRAKEFRASTGLSYLGCFFGYGLGLSALYATTGAGVPCLFRALTGWQCPFCGGTRMGASLLHGDVAAAFRYNPLALVGLVVLAALGVLWTVEALGGPRVRPPRTLGERLGRVHPSRWLAVGLVIGTGYTLARNLL
jgi:hypothetical protein